MIVYTFTCVFIEFGRAYKECARTFYHLKGERMEESDTMNKMIDLVDSSKLYENILENIPPGNF